MENCAATQTIIGLEGHLRVCDLCGLRPDGILVRRFRSLPTTIEALGKAIGVYPRPRVVVLEESTMAQWFVEWLTPLADRVVVADPRLNRLISEADAKADPIDAYKLAELYRIGSIREVFHTLDSARVAFRRGVQQYEDIVREAVKMKNRIRKTFNQYGLDPSALVIYNARRRDEALAGMPEEAVQRLQTWYAVLDALLAARKAAMDRMRKMGKKNEEVSRFQEVPGIGLITACQFSAYIQSPERFRNKSKLCGYARLGVVDRSSAGQPLGRRHLSMRGLGVLKSATRRAFIGAMKQNGGRNAIAQYYRELCRRSHNPIHARLTTQRRILIAVWTMWKKKEAFDPGRFMNRSGV